jgi:hypothetical protein
MKKSMSSRKEIKMRRTLNRVAMVGAFVSLIVLMAQEADARGGGRGGGGFGGGARGGGSSSMSRGGGFGGGGGGGSFSRGGNYNSGNFNRGNVNTGNINRGNVNTGNINRGNINTGNINTGNINTGNINRANINTGNINNVNVNRNVNVDVDNDWHGWGGYYDHPVGAYAAGAVAGAAVTAAVMGSRYYALPAGCGPYPYGGFTYYSCGGAWYKPTYQGDTVVYVVVAKPY